MSQGALEGEVDLREELVVVKALAVYWIVELVREERVGWGAGNCGRDLEEVGWVAVVGDRPAVWEAVHCRNPDICKYAVSVSVQLAVKSGAGPGWLDLTNFCTITCKHNKLGAM